jgi:hypothetical protein
MKVSILTFWNVIVLNAALFIVILSAIWPNVTVLGVGAPVQQLTSLFCKNAKLRGSNPAKNPLQKLC